MTEEIKEKDALAKAWEDYCNKCFKVGQITNWISNLERDLGLAKDAVNQAAIKHDNIKKQHNAKQEADTKAAE